MLEIVKFRGMDSQTKIHGGVSYAKFNAFGLVFWMDYLRQPQQFWSTRTLLEPSGQRDFGQIFFEQSGTYSRDRNTLQLRERN